MPTQYKSKGATNLLPVTSSNADRISMFFKHQAQGQSPTDVILCWSTAELLREGWRSLNAVTDKNPLCKFSNADRRDFSITLTH